MRSLKILFLSQEDVIKAGGKDMKSAIEDVELASSLFEKGDYILPKISKSFIRRGDASSEQSNGRYMSMPGFLGGKINIAGNKWFGGNPSNPFKLKMPRSSGVLVLNNTTSNYPIAIMDGTLISAMRTGAIAGVGAKYLANQDSEVIGLIGAGVIMRTVIMALKEVVKNIREVRLYDKNKERMDRFVSEMAGELSINLRAADSTQECVEGADIFVSAITSNTPVVKNEWVSNGSFYSHMGSYECEFDVISNSNKIVVDSWEAVINREVSTIGMMHEAGLLNREQIYAEMGEIVNGKKPGRERRDERIVFGPIGLVLYDLALGKRIYEKAKELKLGKELFLYKEAIWV